jgi:hypothetical protein
MTHRYDHACGCPECTGHENDIRWRVQAHREALVHEPREALANVRRLVSKRPITDPRDGDNTTC